MFLVTCGSCFRRSHQVRRERRIVHTLLCYIRCSESAARMSDVLCLRHARVSWCSFHEALEDTRRNSSSHMENVHQYIFVLYVEHVPCMERTEKSFLFTVSQSIPMLGSVLRQLQPSPLSIHCNPRLVLQGTPPSFLTPLLLRGQRPRYGFCMYASARLTWLWPITQVLLAWTSAG
jgi:hypothetical protein